MEPTIVEVQKLINELPKNELLIFNIFSKGNVENAHLVWTKEHALELKAEASLVVINKLLLMSKTQRLKLSKRIDIYR